MKCSPVPLPMYFPPLYRQGSIPKPMVDALEVLECLEAQTCTMQGHRQLPLTEDPFALVRYDLGGKEVQS